MAYPLEWVAPVSLWNNKNNNSSYSADLFTITSFAITVGLSLSTGSFSFFHIDDFRKCGAGIGKAILASHVEVRRLSVARVYCEFLSRQISANVYDSLH